MKKKIKKIWAGLLIVVLLVSTLSITAFAVSASKGAGIYGTLTGIITFNLGSASIKYETKITQNPDSARVSHDATVYYNGGRSTLVYPAQYSSTVSIGLLTSQSVAGYSNITKAISNNRVSGGLNSKSYAVEVTAYVNN